jgi:hypothetical protein
MTNGSDARRLLDHGGWELDDAQARRAADPETFWLPDENLLMDSSPPRALDSSSPTDKLLRRHDAARTRRSARMEPGSQQTCPPSKQLTAWSQTSLMRLRRDLVKRHSQFRRELVSAEQ